jgi:hypothetical protein
LLLDASARRSSSTCVDEPVGPMEVTIQPMAANA